MLGFAVLYPTYLCAMLWHIFFNDVMALNTFQIYKFPLYSSTSS